MPTPTGPPVAYGSQQTVQIGDVQNAPGGAIECDSGKLLFFYTRSVSHVGSGSITMRTATNEAAANAGTFSSPTTLVAEGYPYYYGFAGVTKIELGAHAGRVWVAYDRANLPAGTHISTDLIYSDDEGATWSAPILIPDLWTSWFGGLSSSPIVELPSGDLVIAMYGRDTGENAMSCKLLRSTDDGATWEYDSTIVGYESTNDQAEPALALVTLADGSQRLVCAVNSWDTDLAYSTATINIVYTDDLTPGATWSARADSGLGANWGGAPHVWQALDGSVFLLLRNTGANAYKTYFSQSLEFGDAGSFTTSTLVYGTGAMRYGEFINLASGRLGLCFATETSTENAAIYWKVYELAEYTPDPEYAEGYGNTISSGYGDATAADSPAASLTIDPASTAWEQIGLAITVRATAQLSPSFPYHPIGSSTVTATVFSETGGLLRFRGTDADMFAASLDGSSWGSSVTVDAGTTVVYLRVTPETAGTTLTAEVGVPV